TSPPLPPPQRLRFSLGPETAPEVERAKRHLDRWGSRGGAGSWGSRGGSWGVNGAHGSLCASCEPTSLRHVLPGCTDLLRPPGPPCLALARALDDPQAQVGGASWPRGGGGGGTSCPGSEMGVGLPATGVKWGRDFLPRVPGAQRHAVPPPQVRSREGCWLLRGPLVPDGYGVGVGHVAPPDPRDPPGGLRVAVTAFACCRQTEAARLGAALRGALDSLGGLLRRHGPP
ncbi:hypothetical protein FQV10_0007673, partial [Eudyptes schlegeli]